MGDLTEHDAADWPTYRVQWSEHAWHVHGPDGVMSVDIDDWLDAASLGGRMASIRPPARLEIYDNGGHLAAAHHYPTTTS